MNKKCGECVMFDRSLSKCNKIQDDSIRENDTVICCPFYELKPPTLFDRITASLEVLTEKLVYGISNIAPLYHYVVTKWYSNIIPDAIFDSRGEAIAATLEKLKEVQK